MIYVPGDEREITNAPCPMPHAPCPMPHAPCPMPHAPCPMPNECQSFCFFPDCINFIRKQ
ncbi:hypothetical protein [Nostoc sp.]|uniref:hypothetical protein n=1 Tax=Nostoc sp. TaxID=1180 RepID=UPI002FFD0A41